MLVLAGFGALLEMMRFYAGFYIFMGRVLQYWMDHQQPEKLSDADYKECLERIDELVQHCGQVGLTTSEQLIQEAKSLVTPDLQYREMSLKAGEFQRCIEAELKSKFFFYIPVERARYLVLLDEDQETKKHDHVGIEVLRFLPALQKFGGIIRDLENAGNCFAVESCTASVYHLMRVCEYGLVSLAAELGIDPGLSSWEGILRKISTNIERYDREQPPGWKEDRVFYSETATLMTNIKNAWRNSVSHIRKDYDETRARRIFNGVEALMGHLAARLGEKPLPPDTSLTNPEANALPSNQ